MADPDGSTSRPNAPEPRLRKGKQFLEIVRSQVHNTTPLRRWQRAKIYQVWSNPFFIRIFELAISMMITGVFVESSLPLEGFESLALHTGLCGPLVPIFALFSSAVMLDENHRSAIVALVILGCAVIFYLAAISVFANNWSRTGMNRTKYRISLSIMFSLTCLMVPLLALDFVLTLTGSFCGSICRLIKKKGKGKKEGPSETAVEGQSVP